MARLNVGCGSVVDPSWVNVDVIARPGVQVVDVRRPLPFPDATFEACYASHVLEHLSQDAAARLLREMHRVLKPGGIVRIVVPDLEALAREYLAALEKGDEKAHRWAVVELLDQLVRERSGGEMAALMRDASLRETIERRVGVEALQPPPPRRATDALRSAVSRARGIVAGGVVRAIAGRDAAEGFREGFFRAQGEVHRWMYDRLSLPRALEAAGFVEPRKVRFDESAIANFTLDGVGAPRKPDSLFVEARKP